MSTEKTSKPIFPVEDLGSSIKALRKSRGWNQSQFAEAFGVTQGQVSLWEKNVNKPSPAALVGMSRLADDEQSATWMYMAGIASKLTGEDPLTREIPILRDAAAAGTPRAIEEKAVEVTLSLPSMWFPIGGKLYGVRVEGDSMSPILESGYIAFVDVSEAKIDNRVGKMVVARDADGVTIKWLRKQGKLYILVPQHVSPRHEIRVIEPGSDVSIVGEVVKWIGEPPPPPKGLSGKRK